MEYVFSEIEKKWRNQWEKSQLYKVEIDTDKPKYYVLDMFPYPSGAGLHVGHPLGYIASDIFSRYKRLNGFNVLHPMGFDAFGLPAEEYAIATGVHPEKSTKENIQRYKKQLDNIGFSFDWSREVITCDSQYYKWTQWIFSLLFEHYFDLSTNSAKPISSLTEAFSKEGAHSVQAFSSDELSFSAEEWNAYSALEQSDILTSYRLAYRKIGYVNWCENLGTVLANDQIKDGLSERGGHPVERKAMTQWYLRTTAYAERLLNDLENIDWSSSLKAIQRNWIGKSKGAKLFFEIADYENKLEIFTTRPDTIFGATYMVLAPEHPFIVDITTNDQKDEIESYLKYVKTRSERDRMSDVKEVTGAFTGAYAINPFNNKKIPVWVGEYVLMDYGTGAIMAVPSDDERDFAFAQKFGLEVIEVIDRSEHEGAKKEDKVGKLINSDFLNGLPILEAIATTCNKIEEMGIGEVKINYKIRDANFSRQRYWGEPFPIVYNSDGIPQLDPNLPVELPKTDDFKPTKDGQSPLSRISSWVETPLGRRETDTMPAVAGSSWYYLRYMDPKNDDAFASKESLEYWDSVDLYVGGSEHAVAHLLYARFWHKFLYDLGYLPSTEPFKKLINQGMIQGVIEYIALVKSENGDNIFYSEDALTKNGISDYSRIPVYIDFVSQYG
ncbi:MAG: leucine--tRNA ligase, partial [Saprospiraceae bacterium]|nr:leucine--tRNA ligase [Saprospiraceae bacterium]